MTGEPRSVGPAEFARLVAGATDEQLAAGIAANREPMLSEIFRQMPSSFDPQAAGDIDAVVEWQVTGGPEGRTDRWQVVLRSGRCHVVRDGDEEPQVVFRIGPLDFVRLVAGQVSGPKLFTFGRLTVRGNLVLATRVPTLFRLPGG